MKLATPESVGMCSHRLSSISDTIKAQLSPCRLSGVSMLVARKGQVVHFDQVGFADLKNKTPIKPDMLFRIYSMSKPVICTAFMTLYERGLVDLFDPVSKFIPAFGDLKVLEKLPSGKSSLIDIKQPMTVQHLLTHTSGLSYDPYEEYTEVSEAYRQKRILSDVSGVSLEQFIDRLAEFPLAFQPGSHWHYSVSIDVIARIIEVIADMPLHEFLNKTLFQPLGMHDTGFYVPEEKRDRVATMYGDIDFCHENTTWSDFINAWGNNKGINPLDVSSTDPVDDINFQRGGYGLKTSVQDYFCFTQMLLNKGELDGTRVLAPLTVEFMCMNHLNETLTKASPVHFDSFVLGGYGFGLGSRVLLNVPATGVMGSVGEFGWAGAAKTYYWVDPKEEIIGIFMAQSMINLSMIERSFQAMVYQAIC